jgi:hypothetical protein
MTQLFDPQLVNTSGCELPTLPLTPEQNEILQKIIEGEFLRSPLEGMDNFATETLAAVADDIQDFANTPVFPPDSPEQQGKLTQVAERITNAQEQLRDMAIHADRLSGVAANPQNAQGLQGIQSIARTFNNFKNSIEGGTIGQDLVDHYTPFFQSILGPGKTNFEIIKGLIDGDFTNALRNANASPEIRNQAIEDLFNISTAIDNAVGIIESVRLSDQAALAGALDYLSKVGLGFSVLGMAEDPCFSQNVLQNIVNPDFKGLLKF